MMSHRSRVWLNLTAALAIAVITLAAKPIEMAAQEATQSPGTAVPTVVQFSGVLRDETGKPLSGTMGVTFLLYKEQQGGSPLWLETQNVEPDKAGRYSVMLGSTSSNGLPNDIFIAGEARWLALQAQGQPEQPRIMLLSVPYAMKAGDAETVGGFPASAFMLASSSTGGATSGATNGSAPSASTTSAPSSSSNVTTTGGTVSALPLWTTATNIQSSALTQTGTGATAKIGINTNTPAATLDVKGSASVEGPLTLPATGAATATAGKNSQPQGFVASSFNSSTSKATAQTFQWQAEAASNDTSTPSGTLNLLFGSGTNKPAETGLHVASNGQITFAAGQTFPGTGTGTITGVTAGTDLTGGGGSGNVTLNVDTTKVPQLNVANTFTGNQTVNGNVSATGLVSSAGFEIGNTLFDYGNSSNANSFLGFGGNLTMTGQANIAAGVNSLIRNTTGAYNTAIGFYALNRNTTGSENTANGDFALNHNTTGSDNTASGSGALGSNTTGSDNTASGRVALGGNATGCCNTASGSQSLYLNSAGTGNAAQGYQALFWATGSNNTGLGTFAGNPTNTQATTGSNNTYVGYQTTSGLQLAVNNATAIGANAEVDQNNSLVLGSINGVNGATADTNVGIGTTAPQTLFHIDHAPPVGVGMDVAEISSGGGIDVASLLLKNTGSGGLRLRVGAGTGSGYLASSGTLALIAGDSGSPSFPNGPAMTMDSSGNVHIPGNLSKGGGSFKIDHPVDPANKYLSHSFVESPDMMNIYNGVVRLDARGAAWITLPTYFEALNRDFRYQLTSLGKPQPNLYVASEISRNRFKIAGGKASGRVSWQVTGVRHDAWANAHRIPIEEDKPPQERGRYFHPELFGAPPEQRIGAISSGTRKEALASEALLEGEKY